MNWLHRLFCRHRHTKEMTVGDYWKDYSLPETYFCTICKDCDKIIHGNWMGGR